MHWTPCPDTLFPGSVKHTALKSRWSLLYCQRLAKRLEAAREDFSLSGLGAFKRVRVKARRSGGRVYLGHVAVGWVVPHLSLFFLMKTSFRSPSK